MIRIEALLLIVDSLEQIGCADQSLSYIAEVVALAEKSTPALCANVYLSLVRIWYRFSSPKLEHAFTTLDSLPCNRGDSVTPRAVGAAKFLNSLLTSSCTSSNDEIRNALQYRDVGTFWDVDHLVTMKSATNSNLHRGTKRYLHECRPSEAFTVSHLFPYSFDVIRSLRRRVVIERIALSSSPISSIGYSSSDDALVLTLSTCSVSSETACAIKSDCLETSGEAYTGSAALVNSACSGDLTSIARVKDTLKRTISSQIGTHFEGALCAVVHEPCSNTIIISRYDLVGTYSITIPGGEKLEVLLAAWAEIMIRNSKQLKCTASEDVTKWSSKEKRQWWDERQKLDADLQLFLNDLEALLGPWKSLLVNLKIKKLEEEEVYCYESIEQKTFDLIKSIISPNSRAKNEFLNEINFILLLLDAYSMETISRQDTYNGIKALLSITSTVCAQESDLVDQIIDIHEKYLKASLAQNDSLDLKSLSISLSACAFGDDEPDEVEEINYEEWKVADLRSKLKSLKLSTVGIKNDLIHRLKQFDSNQKHTAVQSVPSAPQRKKSSLKDATHEAPNIYSQSQDHLNLRQSLLMYTSLFLFFKVCLFYPYQINETLGLMRLYRLSHGKVCLVCAGDRVAASHRYSICWKNYLPQRLRVPQLCPQV